MTRKRIYFTAWGRGDFRAPAYAVWDQDGCQSRAGAVAGAIARKSGLGVASIRSDGHSYYRGEIIDNQYQMTLGDSRPGGGWTPRAEVWFSIPRMTATIRP